MKKKEPKMSGKDSWKFLTLAMEAGLLGGAVSYRFLPQLAQAQQNKVIEAEQFRVVDKDGETRAVMGLFPTGEALLTLYSKDDNSYVSLSTLLASPSLNFVDKDGISRISFALSSEKLSSLIFPESPKPSVGGESSLSMREKDGQMSFLTESYLTFSDKERKVIWKAPN